MKFLMTMFVLVLLIVFQTRFVYSSDTNQQILMYSNDITSPPLIIKYKEVPYNTSKVGLYATKKYSSKPDTTVEELAKLNPITVEYAVWENGQVIWGTGTKGLYHQATFDPSTLKKEINDIRSLADSYFAHSLNLSSRGPDSSFKTIVINHQDIVLKMESWHEKHQGSSTKIVTEKGIRGLKEGENPETALKEESVNYQTFIALWTELDVMIRDTFIPKDHAEDPVWIDFEPIRIDKASVENDLTKRK